MYGRVLVLIILVLVNHTYAQDEKRNIEESIEGKETSIDLSMIYENMGNFRKINLNKDYFKLSSLPFLSPLDIKKISNHIIRFGNLISYEELQVAGITRAKIKALESFSYINFNPDNSKKFKTEYYYLFQLNKPNKQGYSTDVFKGDPMKHGLRFKHKESHWGTALSFEKDAGEQWFPNKFSPFDHNTGYVYINPKSRFIRQVVIGDYVLSYGQGLTLGLGFNLGKNAMIVYSKNMFLGIKPHHSFNEMNFYRGMATSLKFNKFSMDLFLSKKGIDASINLDSISQENAVLSLNGFHRTEAEIEKRNNLMLKSGGIHVAYETSIGNIGITHHLGIWDKAFSFGAQEYKKILKPHDGFMFTGFDFDFMIKNWNIYGESSYDYNQKTFAMIGSVLTSLSKSVDLSIVGRNYPSNFSNQFGSAFGENSINRNENGIYSGMVWKYKRKFAVKVFYDYYLNPSADYQAVSSHNGNGFLMQAEYFPKRRNIFYVRFRSRRKQYDKSLNLIEKERIESLFSQLRFHYDVRINKVLRTKSRIEMNFLSKEDEMFTGLLVYQDIHFKPLLSSWSFKARLAYFNTDNYQTSVYAFEPELLYNYRVFAYYGNGNKLIFTVRKKLGKSLTLSIRPAWVFYSNEIVRGSGKDKRIGKVFSDYKIVLYGRF